MEGGSRTGSNVGRDFFFQLGGGREEGRQAGRQEGRQEGRDGDNLRNRLSLMASTTAGHSMLGKRAWLSRRMVAGMWLAKKNWKTVCDKGVVGASAAFAISCCSQEFFVSWLSTPSV